MSGQGQSPGLEDLRTRWQEQWSALQTGARALVVCEPDTGLELQTSCRAAGVESDLVTSVPGAEALAGADRYEVLVLSLADSIPLIEKMRDAGDRRPVLFVATGAGAKDLAEQAMAAGADDYLLHSSPFVRSVGAKARANLDRRILERITMLMTDDLKQVLGGLDPQSHRQMMAELTFSLRESRRLLRRRGCRILVVEPDESARAVLCDVASGKNVTVMIGDPAAVVETMQVTPVQVIVTSVSLPTQQATGDLVRAILEYDPQIEVVLAATAEEVDKAVEGINNGAFDCIVKPVADLRLASRCVSRARRSQEQTTLHEHLLGELRRLTHTYAGPDHSPDADADGGLKTEADRRLEPRIPIQVQVSLWPVGNPAQLISARSLDVSLGGVGVETDAVLPVGTLLGLSLELPGDEGVRTVILEGAVSWVALGGSGGVKSGFGVRFTRANEVVKQILTDVIRAIRGP